MKSKFPYPAHSLHTICTVVQFRLQFIHFLNKLLFGLHSKLVKKLEKSSFFYRKYFSGNRFGVFVSHEKELRQTLSLLMLNKSRFGKYFWKNWERKSKMEESQASGLSDLSLLMRSNSSKCTTLMDHFWNKKLLFTTTEKWYSENNVSFSTRCRITASEEASEAHYQNWHIFYLDNIFSGLGFQNRQKKESENDAIILFRLIYHLRKPGWKISGCLQETILKSYEDKTGETINAYLCQSIQMLSAALACVYTPAFLAWLQVEMIFRQFLINLGQTLIYHRRLDPYILHCCIHLPKCNGPVHYIGLARSG